MAMRITMATSEESRGNAENYMGSYRVNYGKVGEFVPSKSMSWSTYIERLEFYYEANGITEENIKRAIFLTACGDYTYNTIRSLVTPRKPRDVTLEEILKMLNEHFAPKPNEIVQRYNFFSRTQGPDETVANFVEDLRRRSEFCNFENLDKALRDRLVCGIREEGVQRRLLSETTLTFKSALEIAIAAETANKNVSHIRNDKMLYTSYHVMGNNYEKNGGKMRRHFENNSQRGATRGKLQNEHEYRELKCYRCTGPHKANMCKFEKTICNFCKVKGHIEVACFRKKKSNGKKNGGRPEQRNYLMSDDITGEAAEYGVYVMDKKWGRGIEAVTVQVKLNGIDHMMEIDTGAARSIISETTYKTLWKEKPRLKQEWCQLKTWSKQMINAVGKIKVQVIFKNEQREMTLWVMKGDGPSLIGRDWFTPFGLYVGGLQRMEVGETNLNIKEFHALFSDELGTYKGEPMNISINNNVSPVFKKSRQIPFVLIEKVNEELDRLSNAGVIEAVTYSKWATPIVVLHKKDGTLRICGDYKCTVNLAIDTDTYPLPTMNESFASLSGGKLFTRLDLNQAYTQVRVDKKSAEILTWNTPKGLFKVNRLPFGIKSAPGLFQRLMATQLADIKGVVVLLDDILIGGKTVSEHDQRVKTVLQRLQDAGLCLKAEKCAFGVRSVTYLGYRVDEQGIHPTTEKIQAIMMAPEPENKVQLQAFLGLYNFYERFMPGKAHVLEHLHRLLDSNKPWYWGKLQKEAFENAKKLITSDAVLTHYSLNKPLVLICDASPYGVGAVLTHRIENGSEKPIAFGSRTLHKHERNYAQIDKEALAIIFGLCKFRQYVYGRELTIVTDHKPLLGLLQTGKQTPAVMSPRMLRWSVMLNAYDYKLEYRPGSKVSNADGLSRLPEMTSEKQIPSPAEVLLLENHLEIPYTGKDIAEATKHDITLIKVKKWVESGWPEKKVEEVLKPYWIRRMELSLHEGCLLWGNRVVIPTKLRVDMLELLHAVHQGIVNTKAIARSYIWWPGMDSEIERWVKLCRKCMEVQNNPRKEPESWKKPVNPWSRIHLDFAGPFQGKMFLLVVDAYSGWAEVELVNNSTTAVVIRKVRKMFATYGLPDVVVSDNGTAFTSSEFAKFLETNGVKHIRTAPFHPATNGTAERMVQVLKKMLHRIEDKDWETRLDRVLFAIRTTPRATTGRSPAEMFMNRQLQTHWHKLQPRERSEWNQNNKGHRRCEKHESVYARNYVQGGIKWLPGKIIEVKGRCHYKVQLEDGRVILRHIDQLMSRMVRLTTPRMETEETTNEGEASNSSSGENTSENPEVSKENSQVSKENPEVSKEYMEVPKEIQEVSEENQEVTGEKQEVTQFQEPGLRRSNRVIVRPKRLLDYA